MARSVKEWFQKYLYHSIATTCIRGLIFSHSFANHAIISILIVYLTSNWSNEHFQIAAVVTNVQDGFLGIMVIFLAHFPSSYMGSFKLIVTTNAAYIAGLAILWRSARMTDDEAAKVYYGAVLLLILGEAGRSAALREFLDVQYLMEDNRVKNLKDEELREHQDALWDLPWLLGAIIPLFLVKTTWGKVFMISTIVMGFFSLLFCCGYSSYFINKSPEDSQDLDHLQRQDIRQDNTGPAAAKRDNIWSMIRKMKRVTQLRRQVFSVWVTFLVYSVISAAGSTFFYEQMSNLRAPIRNYNIAVYFEVMASISKHVSSCLWERLKFPKDSKKKPKVSTLVRIGCGMACVVACIATAWRVEIRRLTEVRRQGVGNTSDDVPMSIFRLVPQFCLLGIMEGLIVDGLIEFFVERVAGSDDKEMVEYYASHTSDLIIGVGKLLTALSILAFRRRWFDDNINMSRLDKYYRALTFMSIVGFCYYVCFSTMCRTNAVVGESTERQENETNSQGRENHESSPHEPSHALHQEPQDFIYHEQPPPPQHQPPPLPSQYYLSQYPPPLQEHSPEPQPYQPQPYNSYPPQSGVPPELYPPQPYSLPYSPQQYPPQ